MKRKQTNVPPILSVKKVLQENGMSITDTPRDPTKIKVDMKDGKVVLSTSTENNSPIRFKRKLPNSVIIKRPIMKLGDNLTIETSTKHPIDREKVFTNVPLLQNPGKADCHTIDQIFVADLNPNANDHNICKSIKRGQYRKKTQLELDNELFVYVDHEQKTITKAIFTIRFFDIL